MNNDESTLKSFLNEHSLPIEVEQNLKKQVRDRPRFEVNTGSEEKPYGVGKSFYEQIVADEDTAILGKSYDFNEEKKNPQDDGMISFPKFEIYYSLGQYIQRFYDLSERKEQKLLNWIEDGVPKQYVLQELPDDGAKYNSMKREAEGEPNLAVYQFLNSEWIKDKEHIVWEENPHQAYTQNISMSLVKEKNKFDWNKSDPMDVVDVDDDIADKQGILNKLVHYDLHQEVDEGLLHMFLTVLKDVQDDLERYESRVDNDEFECDKFNIRENIDGIEYTWQIPKSPNDFSATYTTQDKEIREPFSLLLNTLKPEIYDKIDEEAERGDMYAVRELSKLLDNLQSLTLMSSPEFHMTVNWSRVDMLSKKSVNKGKSPFSVDGDGSGTDAYITFHRQYLEILDDISRENDIKVTINYANADMSEGGLIKSRVEDAQEYSIEIEDELKTNIHHIEQSFAKTRTTNQKNKAIKSIKKLLELRGQDVGTVSYMNYGYDEDIPLGNSKGREFQFDADAEMVVGTPRKNDWQYAVKHLLIHKTFPESGEFDGSYNFPQETIDTGFSIDGYKEESLNEIYVHSVLQEKVDAVFRLRDQTVREKDIYIFGQMPPKVREIFSDCRWNSYDNYQRLMESELLPRTVLKDTVSGEVELPYIPDDLPRGLWRDGRKLKKTQNNYDEIEELVFKDVISDVGYLSDELDCSKRTVKRNVEKNNNLIYVDRPGRGKSNQVQRRFKLKDFFPNI